MNHREMGTREARWYEAGQVPVGRQDLENVCAPSSYSSPPK